ncbi:hypothetical protein [Arthrobacter sp. NPDC089319]|uniref:hypothetical protein n=1 Tax=Arthrobacter sp. NPDC089319 TaxID=3155915 RepID=UPI00341C9815
MGARPRYIVTSIRVAAGSFLTATAVATVVVMGSAPATAATATLSSVQPPVRAVGAVPLLPRDLEDLERYPGQGLTDNTRGIDGPGGDRFSAGDASADAGKLLGVESAARLDGIRQEMDQAVQLKMVTADQADRFVNQIQERILRGL